MLWGRFIDNILIGELGFKNTTHEKNLYAGTFQGKAMLICRQVDDLAVACSCAITAANFIKLIDGKVSTTDHGLLKWYNGVDVEQTRDYIKVHSSTYISRLLATIDWDTDKHDEAKATPTSPIQDKYVKELDDHTGPLEGTTEHRQLEQRIGFGYRKILGALLYAYVTTRLDIGTAIVQLSRYSTAPAEIHYLALKNVGRYLRKYISRGIVYWRAKPRLDLPAVPLEEVPTMPADNPPFPPMDVNLLRLLGYVDAAYGTDTKSRKSVTGVHFCLSGAAVLYKTKMQTTVALSSTEAELIAAVFGAKQAKYLRMVLTELGFPQAGPTAIMCDNDACIKIVNNKLPTPRTRHVDIQYFAIQEWQDRRQIDLLPIPGVNNPSDAATKILGPTLHHRHCLRSMGYFGRPGS